MPKPKIKRRETNFLECCPLCQSSNLVTTDDFELETPTDLNELHEVTEVRVTIRCEDCDFEFMVFADIGSWQYETPSIVSNLVDKLRLALDQVDINTPTRKANPKAFLVNKMLYAKVLQILADEALEDAQNNAKNAPNATKHKVTFPIFSGDAIHKIINELEANQDFMLEIGKYEFASIRRYAKILYFAEKQGWRWAEYSITVWTPEYYLQLGLNRKMELVLINVDTEEKDN